MRIARIISLPSFLRFHACVQVHLASLQNQYRAKRFDPGNRIGPVKAAAHRESAL